MTERFIVQVDRDQFDRLARPTQPLAGSAELIWNALDAEAETVVVTIGRNDLDGVETVLVTDDGTWDDTRRDLARLPKARRFVEKDKSDIEKWKTTPSRQGGLRSVPGFRSWKHRGMGKHH